MTLYSAYTDLTELNLGERAAHLTLRFIAGEEIRAAAAAKEYGVHKMSIYRLLDSLTMLMPIDRDEASGCWRLMDAIGEQ